MEVGRPPSDDDDGDTDGQSHFLPPLPKIPAPPRPAMAAALAALLKRAYGSYAMVGNPATARVGVVFSHGLGDTHHGFQELVEDSLLSEVADPGAFVFILPSAGKRVGGGAPAWSSVFCSIITIAWTCLHPSRMKW